MIITYNCISVCNISISNQNTIILELIVQSNFPSLKNTLIKAKF